MTFQRHALLKRSHQSFVSVSLCSEKELGLLQPLLPGFLDIVWIQPSNQTQKILKRIIASLQTCRAVISVKVVGFIIGDLRRLVRTQEADGIHRRMIVNAN